jgi:hypothetical protein
MTVPDSSLGSTYARALPNPTGSGLLSKRTGDRVLGGSPRFFARTKATLRWLALRRVSQAANLEANGGPCTAADYNPPPLGQQASMKIVVGNLVGNVLDFFGTLSRGSKRHSIDAFVALCA